MLRAKAEREKPMKGPTIPRVVDRAVEGEGEGRREWLAVKYLFFIILSCFGCSICIIVLDFWYYVLFV